MEFWIEAKEKIEHVCTVLRLEHNVLHVVWVLVKTV